MIISVITWFSCYNEIMYLNIAYVSQFFGLFKGITYSNNYIHFAIIATIIQVAVVIAFLVFHYFYDKKSGKVRAWQVMSDERKLIQCI